MKTPWLLACPLKLKGPDYWGIYHDRWPIEQLPLASKHMVGAHRQFVFAEERCYRLPELSLIAGSIQTYLAATLPPIPTGFWDCNPKRTPGRLRRLLARVTFSDLVLPEQGRIRKKASVTDHLPKGICKRSGGVHHHMWDLRTVSPLHIGVSSRVLTEFLARTSVRTPYVGRVRLSPPVITGSPP